MAEEAKIMTVVIALKVKSVAECSIDKMRSTILSIDGCSCCGLWVVGAGVGRIIFVLTQNYLSNLIFFF